MPAKAIIGPAAVFLAASCIACAWAEVRVAAAIVGLRRTAARCRSLIIFSSSSEAFMELMPKLAIRMP